MCQQVKTLTMSTPEERRPAQPPKKRKGPSSSPASVPITNQKLDRQHAAPVNSASPVTIQAPSDADKLKDAFKAHLSSDGSVRSSESMAQLMEASQSYPVSRVVSAVAKTSELSVLRRFVHGAGLVLLQQHIAKSAEQGNIKRVDLGLALLQKLPVTVQALRDSEICKCVKRVGKQSNLGQQVVIRAKFLQSQYSRGLIDEATGRHKEVVAGELPQEASGTEHNDRPNPAQPKKRPMPQRPSESSNDKHSRELPQKKPRPIVIL